MASTLSRSTAAVQADANAVCALLNNGYLRIYSGSQPVNADTALGAQVLLAELRLANPTAFGNADSTGLATANAISAVTAAATGTAAWFRALKSDGTTAVMDGGVATSAADLNINATGIVAGASVSVTAFTYQAQK